MLVLHNAYQYISTDERTSPKDLVRHVTLDCSSTAAQPVLMLNNLFSFSCQKTQGIIWHPAQTDTAMQQISFRGAE